ncbi:putative nuclease HARBI1 [Panicum virgatum]|uniref:putative nuclease HARBI1 n=1 Tax=Panicum virgatum TaxID=38727 RepID=UPI0019D5C501|nr:putative nuclease HARBI1 [Panicum virgatum]
MSSEIDGDLDRLMWELTNDPLEAEIQAEIDEEIEEEIEASIQVDLATASNQPTKKKYIDRNREDANKRLEADYFCSNPVYTDAQFQRRFMMRMHIFLRIVQILGEWSPYFRQRRDAFGKKGFSPLLKCTAAMRMLAYGSPADLLDEGLRIAESTVIECLTLFVKGIRENFGAHYLRRPTEDDIRRLLQIGEARGFPGMLGSVDCMHWQWKNCPVAWKGQYTRGDHKVPTIMLEAVASHDMWIWHAFFGVPGSNNDINVLNQSPLFTNILQGSAPPSQFTVNGNQYNMGYYLADGIYPEWAAFVKTIPLPYSAKHKLFATKQEAARKDVERAFGVLQARFAILRGPARFWNEDTLTDIMYACIILHNMIVEDERDSYQVRFNDNEPYDIRAENEHYEQGTS